jgi:hypothetical protein
LVTKSQTLVIHTAQMQNGGLHVVQMDGILGDIPGELVGRSVNESRFDSASG